MRKIAVLASAVLCSFLEVVPLFAETVEVQAAFQPPAVVPEAMPEPRLLFEAGTIEPAARLAAARLSATAEIEAIASWNAGGRRPQKSGFVRPLEQSLRVELGAVAARSFNGLESHGVLQVSPEEGVTWATRVEVEESSRLRLRLEAVDLPEDAELLVYNESGEAVRFGLELRDGEGLLWTPSVAGPAIFLEVHGGPAFSAGRFEINAIAEDFELDEKGRPQHAIHPVITSCLIASACVPTSVFSNIAVLQGATAHIRYIRDGGTYVCSGGLLNDRDESGHIPYLLTANHCFSNQGSASSIEAFWDYRESSCGGPVPSLANLPRSNGSTLLATSASSDFTFVRLNTIPGGRYLLGWTTATPPGGSSAYSVHHPQGWQQAYSRTVLDSSPSRFCNSPVRYHYTNRADGTSMPGSSGAPLTNANAHVIGQLLGACAANTQEPCLFDGNDYVLYGKFSETYGSISSWLTQTGGTPGTPCVDNATTLCLLSNRFKVQASYRTSSGQTGAAKAVRLTQETGYFWFFNQSNIETVFKLLDGCGLNSRYWVFAGGLTDVEVTTTITDTARGLTRTFYNPLNTPFQPIGDTAAFATCP